MNTMPPIGTPCRHMTDRDNGLCCAIKGLKLADPEKCGAGRIVMPEGMDLVLYCESKNSFVARLWLQLCASARGFSRKQAGPRR